MADKSKKNKPKIERASWFKRLRSTKLYKWLFRLLILIIIAPFVLTLLYKIEGVQPVSTLMLGHYFSSKSVKRDWISIDDVAPVLRNSVVMSEDGKFCNHNGVDWDALNKVIDDALDGEKTRGASTLTMQTVKNLFLWNSRSFIRKGMELPLSLYFDAVLSKRRIMEIYLNVAEWGNGIFGIEAASKHYFGKSAKRLSANQAALLTVALPNPHLRNPQKPSKSLRRLANIVQKRAKQAGAYIGCLKKT